MAPLAATPRAPSAAAPAAARCTGACGPTRSVPAPKLRQQAAQPAHQLPGPGAERPEHHVYRLEHLELCLRCQSPPEPSALPQPAPQPRRRAPQPAAAAAAAAVVPSTRALRGTVAARRAAVRCRGAAAHATLDLHQAAWQAPDSPCRLQPSEELQLARAVQRGAAVERAAAALAARRAARTRPPTGAQLAAAAGLACGVAVEEALQEGWAARQRLVDCNRPLVLYMAAKLRGLGLALEDLVSEGMAALDQAAVAFCPEREGARFSTFAGTAVFRNMLRAVHNYGRVVPLPARMHQAMQQVRGARRRLQQSLGREPTPAEIAAAAGMSPEQVLRLEAAFRQPWSVVLEAESSESRGSEVEADDVVDADGQEWEGNDLQTAALLADVAAGLAALKPNQREAVALRHGLGDCTPRTWREVGEEMEVTHQRAQAIHAAAMKQLRKQLGVVEAGK